MILNHLELYTDGGAIKVGKKYYGSSAFVIRYGNQYYVSSNPVQPGTNNFYELKAMRDGLQTIVNTYKVKHIEIWVISILNIPFPVLRNGVKIGPDMVKIIIINRVRKSRI